MTQKTSTLTLKDFTLTVTLGWPKAERKQKQPVLINFYLNFPKPPKACHSDQLDDTLCYRSFLETIKTNIASRQFFLLEHLAFAIYETAKPLLPRKTKLFIEVTKFPQIKALQGGACFSYGDAK